MVRIRLRRVGARGQPSYRIVVADSRSPRGGEYIEVIGFYNPRTEPATMEIKEERALHWLSVGAQPSDPVRRVLQKLGTLERFERLRQGEPMEALAAEAAVVERAPVSPKTRRDLIVPPKPEPAGVTVDEGEAGAEPAAVAAGEGEASAEPDVETE
jgi:small subunit ribosomal protein S16